MHICMIHIIESFMDADPVNIAEAWLNVFPDHEGHEVYVVFESPVESSFFAIFGKTGPKMEGECPKLDWTNQNWF